MVSTTVNPIAVFTADIADILTETGDWIQSEPSDIHK